MIILIRSTYSCSVTVLLNNISLFLCPFISLTITSSAAVSGYHRRRHQSPRRSRTVHCVASTSRRSVETSCSHGCTDHNSQMPTSTLICSCRGDTRTGNSRVAENWPPSLQRSTRAVRRGRGCQAPSSTRETSISSHWAAV